MKNTNKKLVGFYHYGVILTYLSVVAAIVGICFSVGGNKGARPDIGVICLLISGVCDAFDGAVAKTRKNRTREDRMFGERIDSLSDLIAFGVDGKELRTDVAKKEFRTPAFTPTEECTFDLDVTVSRQNLSIKVTPSNKNLTYICHLDKSATYYEFETDMQYAADDLFWTKYNLEAGRTLSDELLTGDIEMKAENLWASTGYVVYAYGCTADGVITTPLTSVRVLTEAGSDTPPATAAKPRLVRVR